MDMIDVSGSMSMAKPRSNEERKAIRQDPAFDQALSALNQWTGMDGATAAVFAASVLAGISPPELAREVLSEAAQVLAEELVVDGAAARLRRSADALAEATAAEFEAMEDDLDPDAIV